MSKYRLLMPFTVCSCLYLVLLSSAVGGEDRDAIFEEFHMGFVLLAFRGVELEDVDAADWAREHTRLVVVPGKER